MIDYDPYLGRQAVGRIQRGCIHNKQDVAVLGAGEQMRHSRLSNLYVFDGLKKVPVEKAAAGEIVVVAGLEDINAGSTITDLSTGVSGYCAYRRTHSIYYFPGKQESLCRAGRSICHLPQTE